jgi:hypothetical protein
MQKQALTTSGKGRKYITDRYYHKAILGQIYIHPKNHGLYFCHLVSKTQSLTLALNYAGSPSVYLALFFLRSFFSFFIRARTPSSTPCPEDIGSKRVPLVGGAGGAVSIW